MDPWEAVKLCLGSVGAFTLFVSGQFSLLWWRLGRMERTLDVHCKDSHSNKGGNSE